MFVVGLSLSGQGQVNRFEKMFKDLEHHRDSIHQAEIDRQNDKLFDQAWELTKMKDSVTIEKAAILRMVWISYIEGACYYRDKGEFDYEGFIARMKYTRGDIEKARYWNRFWKDYRRNKGWRRKR